MQCKHVKCHIKPPTFNTRMLGHADNNNITQKRCLLHRQQSNTTLRKLSLPVTNKLLQCPPLPQRLLHRRLHNSVNGKARRSHQHPTVVPAAAAAPASPAAASGILFHGKARRNHIRSIAVLGAAAALAVLPPPPVRPHRCRSRCRCRLIHLRRRRQMPRRGAAAAAHPLAAARQLTPWHLGARRIDTFKRCPSP